MYVIGILFYIGMVSLYIFFDSIKDLVAQAVQLAPEISIIIGITALYPLVIFLSHLILGMKAYNYGRYLSSQAKLSASAAVSFGLIGTFQGLTQMVSTISAAMSSGPDDTDLVERMNVMINSISSALSSMSYAFITSICGVAASVLVLLSLNFFSSYYKKQDQQPEINTGKDYSREMNLLLSKINQVEEVNLAIAKKLVGLPPIEEDSAKVISLLSDMKNNLNSTLSDIAALSKNQLEIQQSTITALHEFSQIMQQTANISRETANRSLSELHSIAGEHKQALELISSGIDNVGLTLEKTFSYTRQLPELINDKQDKVHELLQVMQNDMNDNLQLLRNDIRLIPDLLHLQNSSTNILIEVQQGFSENIHQANNKLEELIGIQKKSSLSSGKIRESLQQALEIFADE